MTETASAARIPLKDYYKSDVESQEEFMEVVDELVRWSNAGYRHGLRVDLTMEVEKDQELEESLTTQAPAGGATSTTARGITSATARQLADLLTERAALEVGGDYGASTKMASVCRRSACPNDAPGKYCSWSPVDTPDNHYPISGEAYKAWAKALKDRVVGVSPTSPGMEVLGLLLKARKDQIVTHSASRKKRRSSQGQAGVKNYFFIGTAPPNQEVISYSEELPSSQPTESSPDELTEQLFEWSSSHAAWRGCKADLDAIRTQLAIEGYDTRWTTSVSAQEWKDLGSKSGQRNKVIQGVKEWRAARKES